MLSEKEIDDIYIQYKMDLKIDCQMPNLNILFNDNDNEAYIGAVDNESAELFLGSIFSDSKVSKKYLNAILYHEFTHISDRLTFFRELKDESKKRNLLFPYNEFHAAQVEISKLLELYYNSSKRVSLSTMVYGENGTITLKSFLEEQTNEFILYLNFLEECPSIENVQYIMYLMLYNFGYYSICSRYNIKSDS